MTSFKEAANSNQTWLLVKNRLLYQTGVNTFRYERDQKKRRSKLILMIVLVLLLALTVGYLGIQAYGCGILGLQEIIPGVSMIISSLFALFFTLLKAKGELFDFKDYELVMSLPITTRAVINSRFINMYIWNTLFSCLVMVPMCLVYCLFADVSWYFLPVLLIGILVTSLIPTTLAAIFGALITAVSVKFKYANGMATFLSFVSVILVMGFSLTLSSSSSLIEQNGAVNMELIKSLGPEMLQMLYQLYPPSKLFAAGIIEGDVGAFFLFIGLSLAIYGIFVYLLSISYRRINTALTSKVSRSNYEVGKLKQASIRQAIYKKTLTRIVTSTAAATNLLMGCVMALLFSGGLLIIGPEKLLQGMELSHLLPIIKSSAPYIIGAMVAMTNTACVSLAFEGKTIWLIKSLPITPKALYDSYLLVNLSFTIPTSLICSLLMSISLKVNLMEGLLIFIVPLIFTLAAAVTGLLIGNRLAYYDWQEETTLVKQSMMSMLGMLGGLVVVILLGVIANSGILPIAPYLTTIILSAALLVGTIFLYLNECQRPIKA